MPSFSDLHTPEGSNSLDLVLLAGAESQPQEHEGQPSSAQRPANGSLEVTLARRGRVHRRGSVSEEAALAIALRPLLLR